MFPGCSRGSPSRPNGNTTFHSIAFDPVDGVFIFVTENAHTWAYRLKK
jgi:hypothetical protein